MLDHSLHCREQQRAGVARAIGALREAFPQAAIVTNRGFELLPVLGASVDAVAFESLYQGWDQAGKCYRPVGGPDRDWLLAQAEKAKSCGLPVIAIDYCPPGDPALAWRTHERIRRHGIIPSIADGYLQTPYRPRAGSA